ncbi:MAG: ABATE domain-containing protein [Bryobacteraceae bacterium]
MVTEYHGSGNLSKIIERLPVKFIGGRLCLDFVNTVGGRDGTGAAIRDKIANYQDLLAWSVLAGVDRRRAGGLARLAAREAQKADRVLARAIRLREALYRIFKCAAEGRRPVEADAEVLRNELSLSRNHQRLEAGAGGFRWTFPRKPSALDSILWPVPLSAAELLTSGDLAQVRQCGGAECGWMFLDTSRNHRRQWCDMRDCGNRAKVRRFRGKRHAA